MKRPKDEEIGYVIKSLKLGLKDNKRYPNLKIHLMTCTTMEIELLKWVLGERECPYPLSQIIVELSKVRNEN